MEKIMWLQRDERHLLMGYYVKIGEVEKQEWFEMPNWNPVLTSLRVKHIARKVKAYYEKTTKQSNRDNKDDIERCKKEVKKHIELSNRLRIANAALENRKLVKIRKHESLSDVKGISLTIEGYDLGRKYSEWFTRTGLLFAEYRNHWIILIVGFLGGIMGGTLVALLVEWLKNK